MTQIGIYRENISEFIGQRNSTLFIPKKGSLGDYVDNLLPEIGIEKDSGTIIKDGEEVGRLEMIAARGSDIPQRVADYLEKGKSAAGLTGNDFFDDWWLKTRGSAKSYELGVLNTYDWFDVDAEFKRPALCLMNKTGSKEDLPENMRIAVNTSFLSTSLKYLDERFSKEGRGFSITEYDGDTEVTVAEGTNDACIEVVYRGNNSPESAMRKNGLQIVEIVRFSDISLIGAKDSDVMQQEYARIEKRRDRPNGSYTSNLLKDKNKLIKKFGEEAAELVQASATGENLIGEAIDVFYATDMLLAEANKSWKEVEEEIRRRWK